MHIGSVRENERKKVKLKIFLAFINHKTKLLIYTWLIFEKTISSFHLIKREL